MENKKLDNNDYIVPKLDASIMSKDFFECDIKNLDIRKKAIIDIYAICEYYDLVNLFFFVYIYNGQRYFFEM